MAHNRTISPLLWLLGLLLVFVPVLAWLQWRWIGEISDREEERLRTNVRTAATYTAWNFNQRMMLLQQAFALSSPVEDSSFQEELSSAWNLWKQHGDSSLMGSVFVFNGIQKKLYHFDPASKHLRQTSDTVLTALQITLEGAPPISRMAKGLRALVLPILSKRMNEPSFRRREIVYQTSTSTLSATKEMPSKEFSLKGSSGKGAAQKELPTKAAPPYSHNRMMMSAFMAGIPMSYMIVVPDSIYLRQHLLPSLVRVYFHENDYRWAVIQNDDNTLLSVSEPQLLLREITKPDFTTPIGFIPPRSPGRMGRTMAALATRIPLMLATETDSLMQSQSLSLPTIQGSSTPTSADSSMMKEFLGTTEFRVVASRGSLAREVEAFRWRNIALSLGALLILGMGLAVVFAVVARSERLARQQMQFVAGVSHELRTPLAVLNSASENLADGIVKTPEQARRYGQVMKREITRLMEMVEQTLTFAGIQSGKHTYELQALDVKSVIHQSLERNASFLHNEGCSVETSLENNLPRIFANSRALGSALDNLLANAVKYSVGKSRIRITATLEKKEIIIAVQDNGRGIAAKEQKKIFEPFYRTNEIVEAQIHGNGLGLAIVEHTVKQHGGYVSVNSELGKGSTFRVHFPLSKAAYEASDEKPDHYTPTHR